MAVSVHLEWRNILVCKYFFILISMPVREVYQYVLRSIQSVKWILRFTYKFVTTKNCYYKSLSKAQKFEVIKEHQTVTLQQVQVSLSGHRHSYFLFSF